MLFFGTGSLVTPLLVGVVIPTICVLFALGCAGQHALPHSAFASTGPNPSSVHGPSRGGEHLRNQATEPTDWWAELLERHGHVGPWNVLGYRIGKAILRETGARWGDHTLTITCHIPLATPYSCLVDGVAVGTGNSQGRLDLRIGEVATLDFLHISARNKETGNLIVVRLSVAYLRKIEKFPESQLGSLAQECTDMDESVLFEIVRE